MPEPEGSVAVILGVYATSGFADPWAPIGLYWVAGENADHCTIWEVPALVGPDQDGMSVNPPDLSD